MPFAAQAPPAASKWARAGFTCRAHVLESFPDPQATARRLVDRLSPDDADALVFDYVGFPTATLEAVAELTRLPVFELGRLAVQTLEGLLEAP